MTNLLTLEQAILILPELIKTSQVELVEHLTQDAIDAGQGFYISSNDNTDFDIYYISEVTYHKLINMMIDPLLSRYIEYVTSEFYGFHNHVVMSQVGVEWQAAWQAECIHSAMRSLGRLSATYPDDTFIIQSIAA